jgi:hypothetical protein
MPGKSGKKTKAQQRAANLKRYGLTVVEYNRLLEEQQYVCAICKMPNNTNKSLSVDHNHKNGQIRGLLCNHCNRALGLLRDNVDVLQSAVIYLQKDGQAWLKGKLVKHYRFGNKWVHREHEGKIINKYPSLPHNLVIALRMKLANNDQ